MAITVAMRTEVSQLYVALFGRAPDADGLGYWTQRVDSGDSMTTIANAMYATDPARAYYPLFLTNQEIIASFYLNVLGRPADAEGLAYWTAQLNATGATPGSVITTMINVVANYVALGGTDPAGLTSAALFNNKVAVAQYYGEHSGNIADATVVLASVTADPSTVTAVEAQIDSGAIGQSGITVALTTGSDLVNGTAAGDTVTGVFGTAATATYNAGDVIDLGAGTTDTLSLVANGVTTSDAVIVKNVEVINIIDTQGATFDDTLVQNNPGINFTNTQATKTSTVTNAALGSVYGLAGGGNLTVAYTGTSGTADNAMISLAGVGSSTAKSTVNVSSTNTVEKVSIATTGTNYATVIGGTGAATVVVTGNGTNTIDLSGVGAMSATATVDASASTGTNTLALGTNFSSGVTVKGGTGTDTVSATLASATLNAPTFTGVEKFSTTWTAYGILDLSHATGLTSVSVSDKAAALGTITIQNALASVNTLTVSNVDSTAINSALKFGYGSSTHGDLTFNIGSTSATATAVDLGAVTISNSNSLQVTTLGVLAHDLDGLTVKGSQTALGFTVADGGSLTTGGVSATGSLGALSFDVGTGSYFSGGVNAVTPGKTIGDVTVNMKSDSEFHSYVQTSGGIGNIGNVNVNVTGSDSLGHLGVGSSGGSVGNFAMNMTGDNNDFRFWVSAGYVSASHGPGTSGNVGDITMNVTGDGNYVSGDIGATHGDVGNINITVLGDNNSVSVSAYAEHGYYRATNLSYYEAGGGNMGDINVAMNGNSSGYFTFQVSGGHMGNITVGLDNSAAATVYANAEFGYWYSGGPADGGNIGNITVSMGVDTNMQMYVSADSGDVGNINVSATGDNASGQIYVYAQYVSGSDNGTFDSNDYNRGGNIGDITINISGKDANIYLEAVASGGNLGNVAVSLTGTGASGWATLGSHIVGSGSPGGNIGTIDLNMVDNTGWGFGINADATVGQITVTGGNNDWFDLYVSGGNSIVTGSDDLAAFTGQTLTFGSHATVYEEFMGFSGSTGSIVGSFGDYATDTYNFKHVTGSVGSLTLSYGSHADTTINYGSSSHYGIDATGNPDKGTAAAVSWTAGASSTLLYSVSGGAGSIGMVTVAGGDAASTATIKASNEGYTIGSAGGVDASAFLGKVTVNLQEVGFGSATPVGTTIKVGTGGSDVTGTQGSDNIFLNSGKDTIHFDQEVDPNTVADVVFHFTAGAGKDVMDIEGAATSLLSTYTVDTAHTAAAGDIIRLAGITGGHDITSVANLVTAVNAGGDFASVDSAAAHYTIVTAASPTASTLYVFDVVGTAATLSASEVTLVGVVNLDGGGNITTLGSTNFM